MSAPLADPTPDDALLPLEPATGAELRAGAALQLLADVHRRFEPRPGQQQMAQAVAQALDDGRDLVVEAGTGTGKTLAYLLPLLASGRKALVSTATKHLQTQILGHDLPLAAQATGRQPKVAVLKGRANYLCRHRVNLAVQAIPAGMPMPMELVAIDAVARASPIGDRTEVVAVDEQSPIWPDVTSTADNCTGAACPHFGDCFVVLARRRAQAADLVVVNHHLLFADYAVRERWEMASLLPEVGAIVVDEAHALADVAAAFFGSALADRRVAAFVKDLRKGAGKLRTTGLGEDLREALDDVDTACARLFGRLKALGHLRILDAGTCHDLRAEADDLDMALAEPYTLLGHPELAGEPTWQKARETLHALRGDLHRLLGPTAEAELVRWVELRPKETALVGRPVDVAPILQRTLLGERAVRVFTSATLATNGGFGHLREQLGLHADTHELVVPGAFDYARQALLYVPDRLPDPFAQGRDEAVAAHVEQLATAAAGGTFALFSSHRAMRDAYERVRRVLPMTCLVQGEAGKEALLDRFVREQPAVLFATMGFWQGVDLPDHALRTVVLDKIPFPAPDDPLFQARSARLEAQGRQPFAELALPVAATALRQGFGRLVRSRRHRGIVALLDPRVVSRSYGRVLLDALPPARRTRRFSDVVAFLLDG